MEPELFEMLLQSVREADKLSSMTETVTSKLDNMSDEDFENLYIRYGHEPRKSTHTLDELLSQCGQLLTPKGMSL